MLKRVTKYTWADPSTWTHSSNRSSKYRKLTVHVAGSADIRISWCNHDAAEIYTMDIILPWESSTLSTSKSNNQNSVCTHIQLHVYSCFEAI